MNEGDQLSRLYHVSECVVIPNKYSNDKKSIDTYCFIYFIQYFHLFILTNIYHYLNLPSCTEKLFYFRYLFGFMMQVFKLKGRLSLCLHRCCLSCWDLPVCFWLVKQFVFKFVAYFLSHTLVILLVPLWFRWWSFNAAEKIMSSKKRNRFLSLFKWGSWPNSIWKTLHYQCLILCNLKLCLIKFRRLPPAVTLFVNPNGMLSESSDFQMQFYVEKMCFFLKL